MVKIKKFRSTLHKTKFQQATKPAGMPSHLVQSINTAVNLFQQGDVARSEAMFSNILEAYPDDFAANFFLGMIAAGKGQFKTAVALLDKATAIKPDNVDALNNLGVALLNIGKLDEATACFRKALLREPTHANAMVNLANAMRASGCYEEAIETLRKVVQFHPGNTEALYNLANVLKDSERLPEAVETYRQVLSAKPAMVEALYNLGNTLVDLGQLDEAIEYLQKALSINPKMLSAYMNLGVALMNSGRIADAELTFRGALATQPDYCEIHRYLSVIHRYTEPDDQLAQMQRLFDDATVSDEDRIHIAYGLGKAYADLKEYDQSFACYQEGNRLKRKTFDYAPSESQLLFERLKEIFSPVGISRYRQIKGQMDRTPIFIVGMPRSGTSLVEQILASHSQVFGAGELTYFQQCVFEGTNTDNLDQALGVIATTNGASLARLGIDYLNRLRNHSSSAARIVDKLPHNFQYIGFIRLALPGAAIIHCRRDPMDTCLSIYKNYFTELHKYSHDLQELGAYYRLYEDLMRHWQQLFPGSIYELSYEKMITDQEAETRRLLQYLDLPWEDACLTPQKTKRIVATASLAQVRQAVYADSVELWRRYGERLEPLRQALSGGL